MKEVKTELTRDDIVDLLYKIGASKVRNHETNDNIQFTCTVHGENNPSAGVSISKQTWNCFSCHEKGSLPWLVYKSLPDEFSSVREAQEFLSAEYGVQFSPIDRRILKGLRRYEEYNDYEEKEKPRFELDRFELAPFKSGKETYQYFFDRGFTKATLKEYKIGRDLANETVTVPLFWEDNVLAGIIGRYIDPNRPHNQRYKIYNCPTGDILYPLHKLEVVNDTIILVEGLLDALWLHQLGIRNALATLTNNLTDSQMDIVKKYASTIIDFTDNDKMGDIATRIIKQKCKDEGLKYLSVKDNYPQGKKDPQDLNLGEINYMLKHARGRVRKPIRKIED